MTEIMPALAERMDSTAGLASKFASTRQSENTRQAYRLDLIGCSHPLRACRHRNPGRSHQPLAWLPWCYANGLDPWTVGPSDVSVWLADLAAAGQADGTRARRLSAVSAWYRWLVRNGHATRNPADLESAERPPRRTPGTAGTALSRGHLAALVAAADTDAPRSAAIIAAMLLTGLRVSELTGADVGDIGHDRGHTVLTIRGKGGKVRQAPLVPALWRRIEAYLATRDETRSTDIMPASSGHADQSSPLFTTSTGKRLDRAYVLRLVGRLAGVAGIPGTITPHDLRRTFGTLSLDAGVALRDVQDALGHADPRTTRGYDRSGMNPDRHPAYRLGAFVKDTP